MSHLLTSLLVMFMLVGCSVAGSQQDQTIQFCLSDDSEATRLVAIMQQVAIENGMEFIDRSEGARRERMAVGIDVPPTTIVVTIFNGNDLRVTAINFGPGGRNVAVGFSVDADQARFQEIIERVKSALAEKWELHDVPDGEGAFPMSGCN